MEVAYEYVRCQLEGLLTGSEVTGFAANTTAVLAVDGQQTTFEGDATGYAQALFGATEGCTLRVESVTGSASPSGLTTVAASGTLVFTGYTRSFVQHSVLCKGDAADTFFVVSESMVLGDAVAVEAPTPEAPKAEAAPAAAAQEEPEAPAAAAVAADDEQNEVEVADEAPAPALDRETPTPPTPPSSPAPKAQPAPAAEAAQVQPPKAAAPAAKPTAKGWAAVAAAAATEPRAMAPVKQAPAPAPAKPQEAAAPQQQAPRKEPGAPRGAAPAKAAAAAPPRKVVPESTAVVKLPREVSDDELRAALPATLRDKVHSIRNKSGEPTIRRAWIEFTVANSVQIINDAAAELDGHALVAEPPRKKTGN